MKISGVQTTIIVIAALITVVGTIATLAFIAGEAREALRNISAETVFVKPVMS